MSLGLSFTQVLPPAVAVGPGLQPPLTLLQLTLTWQVSAGLSCLKSGSELLLQTRLCLTRWVFLADLTRAVNALPQNMTSQMFSAIAAVTGQGQNPNATPAQWASSQYGYGGSGGGSSAYHVGVA